jgi:hypothetical protein
MADAQKQSGVSDTHAEQNTSAAMSELYGRSLASVSKPGQPEVRAAFNVENGLSGKAGEAGTFVSDRKKDRHSFFRNVAEAFSEWRAMTAGALKRRHLIEEEPKKKITETVHDIMSEPLKQDVPHIAALRSETIAAKPVRVQPERSVPKDVAHEETAEASVPLPPPVEKRGEGHRLQKMRTLKSDAAQLRANKEPAPAAPVKDIRKPEPGNAAVPEKKITEKDVHIVPLDMRASMIAPDVNVRMNGTAIPAPAQAPEKQEGKRTKPITPPAPPAPKPEPLPPIVETPKPPAPAAPEAVPQWTHMRDTDMSVEAEPLPEKHTMQPSEPEAALSASTEDAFHVVPAETPAADIQPAPEVKVEPVLNEDRLARIQEKIRDVRSQKRAEEIAMPPLPTGPDIPFEERPLSALSTAVEPEWEQDPETFMPPPPLAPAADAPSEHTPFHDGVEPVRAPIAIHEEVPSAPPHPLPVSPATRPARPHTFLRFAFRIMLVILFIGTLVGGGVYLFTHVERGGETPLPDITDPTPVEPDTAVPDPVSHELTLGGDTQSFRTSMKEAVDDAPSGIIEIPVYVGEPPHAATTQEFFMQLGLTLPARTLRALEPVFVIGSVTTTRNEPFLLIRSNNFDALFAGLLAWEPSMQEDLAPLFGNVSTTTMPFTDAVRDNRSVRVLHDASGAEIMTYSFIDERTVIMTASMDALAELIKHF